MLIEQSGPRHQGIRDWLDSRVCSDTFVPSSAGTSLAKACCEMSRRDGAIVAWHEVPGTAPPQKSRPVGYGVIRAGVRTDSMIGVTKFRMRKRKNFMLYDFSPY